MQGLLTWKCLLLDRPDEREILIQLVLPKSFNKSLFYIQNEQNKTS